MLETHNTTTAMWPGVSQGVSMKGSGVFVTTGQTGVDRDGAIVTASIEAQVEAMFENMKDVLAAAGLDFSHVARVTSYVASFDPEIVGAIRKVRARYFDAARPPASVMIQAGLYDPRLYVEAELIAVVP